MKTPKPVTLLSPRGRRLAELTRDEARRLFADGLVHWRNRGREVMLTTLKNAIRGASCTMGPAVMEANANGERWAIELVSNGDNRL